MTELAVGTGVSKILSRENPHLFHETIKNDL
jgi:hypothetical protein